MADRRRKLDQSSPTKARWVLGGIAASTLTGLVLFYLFAWQQQGPFGNFYLREVSGQQLFDSARTTAMLIGIIGLGGAGFLAYRRQRTSEEMQLTAQHSHNLSDEQFRHESIRTLRDRYTAAAEQLGSESFAIRLAGVYALAALADDWAASSKRSERQVCIDVLCAYLRSPAPAEPVLRSAVPITMSFPRLTAMIGRVRRQPSVDERNLALREREVRQAILSVIASKTGDYPEPGEGPWSPCRFDLTGANLGRVNFAHSRFDGKVSFSEVTFSEDANFASTIHADTDFTGARFESFATFSGAHFTWRVHFDWARFSRGAEFNRTKFDMETSFMSAAFMGRSVDFRKARFQADSTTYVQPRTVAASTVIDFSDARFDGSVQLSADAFASAREIIFRTSRPWKVVPTVDWDEATLPENVRPRSWPPHLYTPEDLIADIVRIPHDDRTKPPILTMSPRVVALTRRVLHRSNHPR